MKKKLIIYSINALFLVAIQFLFFNIPWSLSSESAVISLIDNLSHNLGLNTKVKPEKFILVNTEFSRKEVPILTPYGTVGTTSIADRQLLSELFEHIKSEEYAPKFVLSDIILDLPSPYDTLLQKSIAGHNNIIFPLPISADSNFNALQNQIGFKAASSGYTSYSGSVNKLGIYDETGIYKSIPAYMYDYLSLEKFKCNRLFCYQKGYVLPKHFYPKYFITETEYKQNQMPLDLYVEMLKSKSEVFYETYVKNNVIIIGNLKDDIHHTSVGKLPGSIVLYNAYLTLDNRYNHIHWSWFLFAFLSFVFVQFIGLNEGFFVEKKGFKKRVLFILSSLLSLSVIVLIISFISSIIFKVYVTIVPVLVYLEIIKFKQRYLS